MNPFLYQKYIKQWKLSKFHTKNVCKPYKVTNCSTVKMKSKKERRRRLYEPERTFLSTCSKKKLKVILTGDTAG